MDTVTPDVIPINIKRMFKFSFGDIKTTTIKTFDNAYARLSADTSNTDDRSKPTCLQPWLCQFVSKRDYSTAL